MPPSAKPMGGADGASPRASNPAGKEGKAKPKKKAPTGKVSLGMPMNKSADLTEEAAKADLDALQKKYGTLVVAFNNQQAELAKCMEEKEKLEQQVESLKTSVESGVPLSGDELTQNLKEELEKSRAENRSLENANMGLQKKVNKLQVEHVSEEEVDQLFYALEVKESELEQAKQDKMMLEQEVLTARQNSARGGGAADSKFIEIHYHNDNSDDEDDAVDVSAAAPAPTA